jgi:hypothetical protein
MTATSEIRLILELDEEPNDKDKETIELLIRSILVSMHPSADVRIATKSGSWIVMAWSVLEGVGKWLIPEFGSWLAEKGFDWIHSQASKTKQLLPGDATERRIRTDHSSIDVCPTEGSEGLQSSDESKIFVKLASQMSTVIDNPVFSNSKKVTFRIGEWSSSHNIGVSASLTKIKDKADEQELEFSVDLTDSVEDFNSRLNF